jgi:peptidyl-dipeptidase A
MFKKPLDRDVDCQPAANDLKYHDDYRVKICTEMNGDYFYIIHHEMGHVEYFMSYDKKQPYVYQDGANPGFHEAVGDTIGMYASKFSSLFFFENNDIEIFDFFSFTKSFNKIGFS